MPTHWFPLMGGGTTNWSKDTPTTYHKTDSMDGMYKYILSAIPSIHACTQLHAIMLKTNSRHQTPLHINDTVHMCMCR